MSNRRGGGGFRGRPAAGKARIGGIDIAYEEDIILDERPQPTPLFPVSLMPISTTTYSYAHPLTNF
jgi:hypothetical protein